MLSTRSVQVRIGRITSGMTETGTALPMTGTSRADQAFPKLTPPQIERLAAHGRPREIRQGDILFEAGDSPIPFFVVTS
jgi:hypothetical protein